MEPMPAWFLEAFELHFQIGSTVNPRAAAESLWSAVDKKLHIVNKLQMPECPEHKAPLSPRGNASNSWLYCPHCPDKLYVNHEGNVEELIETGGCAPAVVVHG